MPDFFSMTFVLAVFYIVFSSQVYLLSIHYPHKISLRVEYMLENFPPTEYPKLYPNFHAGYVQTQQLKIRIYKIINYAIAMVGFGIMATMIFSDYRPSEKGGDEIFVMLYFFLQTMPLLYISWKEHCQYRMMRLTFDDKTRVAELTRRGLFDYVSPIYVVIAFILYAAWLVFYLYHVGPIAAWEANRYVTFITITGMNIFYSVSIFAFVSGKKLDPYKAPKDQQKHAESVVKVLVFSSVMVSIFLTLTQAADQYAFEVFDPVMTSFYMQLCVVFGLGLTMRMLDTKEIDFEVYRNEGTAAAQ